MLVPKVIQKYQVLLTTFIRQLELERARGNESKTEEIKATRDDILLVRWLWRFLLIGAPLCFLVLPLVMTIMGSIISFLIMQLLWLLLKLAMILVFIALAAAIYLTWFKPPDQN